MNKKILLIVSGLVSILVIAIGNTELTYDYCASADTPCVDLVYDIVLTFVPIIPLFILSLITYKMRDEVYRAWLRFAYVWIPLSMLLIFLAPEYSADWMFPIVKGTVAFFSSLLFAGISLILIIYKYFASRRAPGQV
jgi:hypothetical protein